MSKYDNILDAPDQNNTPRTCPECGYQYSFSLFLKRYALNFGFSKWTCPNCQQLITYNYTRSNLIGTALFIVCAFAFQGLQSLSGWEMSSFIFIIAFFFFALILLNLDTFKKYKE